MPALWECELCKVMACLVWQGMFLHCEERKSKSEEETFLSFFLFGNLHMTSVFCKQIRASLSAEMWEQLEKEQSSQLLEHRVTWKVSGLWEGWR